MTKENSLALGGVYKLPIEASKVCLNCFSLLEQKIPKQKYIFSSEQGDFCTEDCAKEYEQKNIN